MFKLNSIANWFAYLFVGLCISCVTNAATNSSNNTIKVGLTNLAQVSIPGAKVRTPGAIELLAMDQADNASLSLVNPELAINKLKNNEIDAWIGVIHSDADIPEFLEINKLDWAANPVLIMRTDTDIKNWQAIEKRSICISKDSRYIGELESLYGAIEYIYPTVTDALLALRIGECDASLQEEEFVNELLSYPEWQKFSARLQPYKYVNLVELQLADDVAGQQLLKLLDSAQLKSLVESQAKDIAFEVYLDQTVPDCH